VFQRVIDGLGRWFTPPGLVMARVAFLAGWLGLRARRLVRFDDRRRIVVLLFEFRDASERDRQLLLELGNQGKQFGILDPQLGDLVFKRHGREYTTS
jgi:hypothetical protein